MRPAAASLWAIAALAGAAAAIGPPGDGRPEPTADRFQADAGRLCADAHARLAGLQPLVEPSAIAAGAPRIAAVSRILAAELQALPAPPQAHRARVGYARALSREAALVEGLARASARGDAREVRRVDKALQRTTERGAALGGRLGALACGGRSAPGQEPSQPSAVAAGDGGRRGIAAEVA